jgi:hypothetical protein
MKQTIIGMVIATAAVVFAGSALAGHEMHADHVNIMNSRSAHAARTVSGTNESTLVDTKSPRLYTVCHHRHGRGHVELTYDNASTTLDPGHCVTVEAANISAKGKDDSTWAPVYVTAHRDHGERHHRRMEE